MSTITQSASPVYSVRDASYSDRVHQLCQFVDLPAGRSVGPKLRAIVEHYSTQVGRELPLWDAIRELDRLLAERDSMPVPREFSRIADFLIRRDYDLDETHEIIGRLRRGVAVADCRGLEAGDREAVAGLMPRAVPLRGCDCERCRDEG